MPNHHDDTDDHVEAGRTRVEDARADDPAAPDRGVTPPVPSYTDDGGTSDLGVDEPALPEADPDDSGPTGMFAGETQASRAEEDLFREELEERFPSTRGDWKTSGEVPPDDA
jgi:hypothetical protein